MNKRSTGTLGSGGFWVPFWPLQKELSRWKPWTKKSALIKNKPLRYQFLYSQKTKPTPFIFKRPPPPHGPHQFFNTN